MLTLLALSGGPDSVYLFHRLIKEGRSFIVAHLNHQIRAESDADEAFVRALAKKHGLTFESKRIDVSAWAKTQKKSLEEAGRILRYAFFEELRQKHHAEWIVTAHHLNDNLETVLMNRQRGCNLRGEIGMQEFDTARHLWRPLLNTSKAEILTYLNRHRLPYRIDSTNEDLRYTRNRIRHKTIPALLQKNPDLLADFKKTRQKALNEYTRLSSWATEWLRANHFQIAHRYLNRFPLKSFLKLSLQKQQFLLAHLYEQIHGHTQGLTTAQIGDIRRYLQRGHGGKQKKLGPNGLLRIEAGRIILDGNLRPARVK